MIKLYKKLSCQRIYLVYLLPIFSSLVLSDAQTMEDGFSQQKSLLKRFNASPQEIEQRNLLETLDVEDSAPYIVQDILQHIFLHLNTLHVLLEVGSVSKDWRKAAAITWKNKLLSKVPNDLASPENQINLTGNQIALNLRGNEIGPEGAEWLSQGGVFSLIQLYLDRRTEEYVPKWVVRSRKMFCLRPEAAQWISRGNFSELTILDLAYNHIGEYGAEKLAEGNLSRACPQFSLR